MLLASHSHNLLCSCFLFTEKKEGVVTLTRLLPKSTMCNSVSRYGKNIFSLYFILQYQCQFWLFFIIICINRVKGSSAVNSQCHAPRTAAWPGLLGLVNSPFSLYFTYQGRYHLSSADRCSRRCWNWLHCSYCTASLWTWRPPFLQDHF